MGSNFPKSGLTGFDAMYKAARLNLLALNISIIVSSLSAIVVLLLVLL